MGETTQSRRRELVRLLPLAVIVVVAVIGFIALRDHLGFEALRENRQSLIAFRDMNYALTALVFIGLYTLIVAFSLPGATIATLTGGFLFATFPGSLFNVTGATLGATVIFLAARWGFGERLGAKLQRSEGAVKRIKQGIDENQWSMLFLIRLVPAVPFVVANLVPSFMQDRRRRRLRQAEAPQPGPTPASGWNTHLEDGRAPSQPLGVAELAERLEVAANSSREAVRVSLHTVCGPAARGSPRSRLKRL